MRSLSTLVLYQSSYLTLCKQIKGIYYIILNHFSISVIKTMNYVVCSLLWLIKKVGWLYSTWLCSWCLKSNLKHILLMNSLWSLQGVLTSQAGGWIINNRWDISIKMKRINIKQKIYSNHRKKEFIFSFEKNKTLWKPITRN